jgi:hypothetical protein
LKSAHIDGLHLGIKKPDAAFFIAKAFILVLGVGDSVGSKKREAKDNKTPGNIFPGVLHYISTA